MLTISQTFTLDTGHQFARQTNLTFVFLRVLYLLTVTLEHLRRATSKRICWLVTARWKWLKLSPIFHQQNKAGRTILFILQFWDLIVNNMPFLIGFHLLSEQCRFWLHLENFKTRPPPSVSEFDWGLGRSCSVCRIGKPWPPILFTHFFLHLRSLWFNGCCTDWKLDLFSPELSSSASAESWSTGHQIGQRVNEPSEGFTSCCSCILLHPGLHCFPLHCLYCSHCLHCLLCLHWDRFSALLLRAGQWTHHVLEIQLCLGLLPLQRELPAFRLLGLGGGGERLEVWLRLGEALLLDHIRTQQVFEV